VTIANNQALCINLNCDYIYVEAVGEITENILNGNTLSMTGNEISQVSEVSIGGVSCKNVVATATSITCEFTEGKPPGGTYTPLVRTDMGTVTNSGSPVNVPLVVTSVTPNSEINYLGGDILTIEG